MLIFKGFIFVGLAVKRTKDFNEALEEVLKISSEWEPKNDEKELPKKVENDDAMVRLRVMFPDTSDEQLSECLKKSNTFDGAVEELLNLGDKGFSKGGKVESSFREQRLKDLCAACPQVSEEEIRCVMESSNTFEEALNKVLHLAATNASDKLEHSLQENLAAAFPTVGKEDIENALAASKGDGDLAVDVLMNVAASKDRMLESSINDLVDIFPSVSKEDIRIELSKSECSFEDAVMNIMAKSTSSVWSLEPEKVKSEEERSVVTTEDTEKVAFLKGMFKYEDEDVLQGLLNETGGLEKTVDFLLSLDLLKIYDQQEQMEVEGEQEEEQEEEEEEEEEEAEVRHLQELLENVSREKIVQALEKCQWDVSSAYDELCDQEKTPKKKVHQSSSKWRKKGHVSEVFGKVSFGKSSKWNGTNEEVKLKTSPFIYESPAPKSTAFNSNNDEISSNSGETGNRDLELFLARFGQFAPRDMLEDIFVSKQCNLDRASSYAQQLLGQDSGQQEQKKKKVEKESFEVATKRRNKRVKKKGQAGQQEGQYDGHIFSQARYSYSPISSQDLGNGDQAVSRMAQIHSDSKRRYAHLATKAYLAGDKEAAKKFSKLAERDEALRQRWNNKLSNQFCTVDLHGYFVKEAMEICRRCLRDISSGQSIRFITGKGLHSVGGIPRIKNALVDLLQGRSDCDFLVYEGYVVVTMK